MCVCVCACVLACVRACECVRETLKEVKGNLYTLNFRQGLVFCASFFLFFFLLILIYCVDFTVSDKYRSDTEVYIKYIRPWKTRNEHRLRTNERKRFYELLN